MKRLFVFANNSLQLSLPLRASEVAFDSEAHYVNKSGGSASAFYMLGFGFA